MLAHLIATTLAATAADYQSVVARARPGDTVQLQGSFPAISLSDVRDLTLDATRAKGGYLYVRNGEKITVIGGEWRPVDWHGGLYFQGGSHLAVSDANVVGDGAHGGILFREAKDVSVSNSSVEHAMPYSIYFGGVTGFRASANAMWGAAGDGIDIAGSKDGVIEDNLCAGFRNAPQMHPDCVQAFAPVGPYPTLSRNVKVLRNISYGAAQGFDGFQGTIGFDVEGNTVVGVFPQGVSYTDMQSGVLKNNHVRTLPGSKWPTVVNSLRHSSDTVVCGNTSEAYGRWPARADPPCR